MSENVPVAVTELPALVPLSQLPCRRSACFDQSMMPYSLDSIGIPVLSRIVNVALTGHTDSAALAALLIGTMRMTNPDFDAGELLDQTSVWPSPSTPSKVLLNSSSDLPNSRGSTDTSADEGWKVNNPIADATAAISLNPNIISSAPWVIKKGAPA
jgi:hypothetical protein